MHSQTKHPIKLSNARTFTPRSRQSLKKSWKMSATCFYSKFMNCMIALVNRIDRYRPKLT